MFEIYIQKILITEACNEEAGSISAVWRLGSKHSSEETSQRWRAVGDTVFDLASSKMEGLISCIVSGDFNHHLKFEHETYMFEI